MASHEIVSPRSRRPRFLIALLAALAVPCAGASQVSVPELKAAFLFNFARFTEWPADVLPPEAPIVLCVVGDPEVAQSLGRAVQGKAVNGRSLVVKKTPAAGALGSCQLLYAGGIDARRARQIIDEVKGEAVLTVSDLAGFVGIGATARLFMDGERMRFAVNVDAALRSQIRISAQMLNLAQIVKDEDDAAN